MLSDRTRATIERVRTPRVRRFTCHGCGQERATLRLTGRLPLRCSQCEPRLSAWVRERGELELRAAIVDLADELQDVQAVLGVAVVGRARKFGEPGRPALRRAVMAVASAAGVRPTSEALLDLAAVAQAWARRLAASAGELATGGSE